MAAWPIVTGDKLAVLAVLFSGIRESLDVRYALGSHSVLSIGLQQDSFRTAITYSHTPQLVIVTRIVRSKGCGSSR